MLNNPLISIITVCYNSESTIRCTLDSILKQTYHNFEYIIVDGKSSDSTLSIIDEYREKLNGRLRVISEKDSGIYNAINKGIRIARGDLVGILNSDDFYSSNTLELVASKFSSLGLDKVVIFGDMERVDSEGKLVYRYHFTNRLIENKSCFGHPSMFVSKKVYEDIGGYNEEYKLASDGEWQYRAFEDPSITFCLIGKVLNHMREGGASDKISYRWKWFKERSKMRIIYHKGTRAAIYFDEFIKIIKTDIKFLCPNFLKKTLYRINYKREK